MKTPYAILIGLALIAAAIFFRQPSIAPAQAQFRSKAIGIACSATLSDCAVLHGDKIAWVYKADTFSSNWR